MIRFISARSHGATATATAICDKMGYIGCLLDLLHGAAVTADCDCATLVSQGVTDMITVNGSCTHFVRQVSATPYTHPTTSIVIDAIEVAVSPCERALSRDLLPEYLTEQCPVSRA